MTDKNPGRAGGSVRLDLEAVRQFEEKPMPPDVPVRRGWLVLGLLLLAVQGIANGAGVRQEPGSPHETDELRAKRQQFQALELMPARASAWVFQAGATPRIVWRDAEEARRLGADMNFQVRWFDRDLREASEPDAGGRWMASLEGTSPNGSPFRRSLTFFVLPEKMEGTFVPDLTVKLPKFPGPDAPPAWREHQAEFDRVAKELLVHGLVDCEKGSILMAGIFESTEAGRPKWLTEWTTVVSDERQLALKLKLAGLLDRVQPLRPPRHREVNASVLRDGPAAEAGVPEDAMARIDAFCEEWNRATGVPFVTLVARRGVIITHRGFGVTATGQPVGEDHRCWIASLSKTVTAILFLQFIDQGLIRLDDRLGSVFPDYSPFGEFVPTFRQCLNHSGGLSGHAGFGGMHNPHLENIVLNGIDANRPGTKIEYCGLGFELVAKAMELVSGKPAARIYSEHLFEPLGFGDVFVGNASSDIELTARELAVLGQWMLNEGSYGQLEFVSPEIFAEMLPRPMDLPAAFIPQGLGLHAVFHRKPGAPADSHAPADLLFGPNTAGHGSFSGCVLVIDPDQDLVIVQARAEFKPEDGDWHTRFFQTVAEANGPAAPSR